MLTIQFIENHGQIYDWGLRLSLRPETSATEPSERVDKVKPLAAGEGHLVTRVTLDEAAFSGVTKPLAEHWYEARQRLSLADSHNDGVDLVFVRGDLGGEQTDLWAAHFAAGGAPATPTRLSVNSLSHDFSPQLVRGEDGSLRLFWISDRRGRGWELWTSRREPETRIWQSATRVALESFGPPDADARSDLAERLLHFGVSQDRRGRWLLVYRAKPDRLFVLVSGDALKWQFAARIDKVVDLLNPAIVEDAGGRYRIAAMTNSKRLHLWSSNTLKSWQERTLKVNDYSDIGTLAPHRINLFGEPDGKLLVLLSDASRGLQYARFEPDAGNPRFDLVRNVGLEAAAVSRYGDGYLIAARRHDGIDVRHYRNFQERRIATNAPGKILYREFTAGTAGDEWRRIYARVRAIQPDVSSVGVAADGRVWWGIESGAMTLKGDDFFGVDVSQGFFHHHVTDIEPCADLTGLASRDQSAALVGVAVATQRGFKFRKRELAQATGRVTAMHCSDDNRLLVGSDSGEVFYISADQTTLVHRFDAGISALASNASGTVIVGTKSGTLFKLAAPTQALPVPTETAAAITAAAYDSSGSLWVAVAGAGVFKRQDRAWHRPQAGDDGAYRDVSILRADAVRGMWMMPAMTEASRGIAYSDGEQTILLNPPDRAIRAPTGLGVSADGVVWIGTAFDGLFQLKRGSNR